METSTLVGDAKQLHDVAANKPDDDCRRSSATFGPAGDSCVVRDEPNDQAPKINGIDELINGGSVPFQLESPNDEKADPGFVRNGYVAPVRDVGFETTNSSFQLLRDAYLGASSDSEDDRCITKEVRSGNSEVPRLSKDNEPRAAKHFKKKQLRKKQVDEELERLLEDLDLSDKSKKCSGKVPGNHPSCEGNTCQKHNDGQVEPTEVSETSKAGMKKKWKQKDSQEELDKVPGVLTSDNNSSETISPKDEESKQSGGSLMNGRDGPEGVSKLMEGDGILKDDHGWKTASQKRKKEKLRQLENLGKESFKKTDSESEGKLSFEDEHGHKSESDVDCNSGKNKNDLNKKDRRRPGKKQLAAIQEAIKKAKEEEERIRREEEAKRKAAEEAECLKQEKLRLEEEKKLKRKQKEKERKEKLKAEGKLLSKSQKRERARMQATLAAFREHGFIVPGFAETKRLESCKVSQRRRFNSCNSTQSSESSSHEMGRRTISLSSQESFSNSLSSDATNSLDSKGSWDMGSVEGLALNHESEVEHMSCSEESDILDENNSANDNNRNMTKPVKIPSNKSAKATQGIIRMSRSLDKITINPIIEKDNSSPKLRSPVVCVLGHVDTGKTKILDYIRQTHVQDSEAGGITQQIGATMIPRDALKEKCKMVKNGFTVKVPGLLVIDTPGHESFSNLRIRGSSICDIAILVVDIMHGLEPQTIESINLLKEGKTPFIVALNKIDRIYGWTTMKDVDIEDAIKNQPQHTQAEFRKRCNEVIAQFANQNLNAALYYENMDPRSFVSMVPASAITGDGMGNILSLVVHLTQTMMSKKLLFSEELEATVLEVKAITGLGTTIDVILVNGRLRESDTIVLAGNDGPLVTQIRSLLMPHPLKELRVKNPYIEYKEVEGAQGVKITGKDLDKTIAGLPLLATRSHCQVDALKDKIYRMYHETMSSIKVSERGVYVQASTLGSLEALLEYLKNSKIPYSGVKIGPVVKKDVMKASVMLEHDSQYAVILAFDVKIERDAQDLADSLGVKIFQANIIYHLFDHFVEYREALEKKKQQETRQLAVFPCKLKIIPEFIFNQRDPIVVGVSVEAGTLWEGTPLCVPSKNCLEIGYVSTIEINNKCIDSAKAGQVVCIKVHPKPGDFPKTYGRHFDDEDLLVSRITRQSIDVCKEHYRDAMSMSDWQLVVELKKMLQVL